MKKRTTIPSVTLANGIPMPALGLGTWKLWGDDCVAAVKTALAAGYTSIDTAERYANQSDIGMAIKNVPRDTLFITSKVWHDHLHHDDLIEACAATLKELRTGYIDLYLVHWPDKAVPMRETFGALNELYDAKTIRAIGVSNFTIPHLRKAMHVSEAPICVNQVEVHPFWHDDALLSFCRENKIAVTAYSPLAQGKVFTDRTITALADKHGRSVSQIVLRWLVQKDCIVIPKATMKERLLENASIFDFTLPGEDMALLDCLTPQRRLVNPDFAEFDDAQPTSGKHL